MSMEDQIKECLEGMNHKNHSNRIKAIKKFEDYVTQNHPSPCDDDVEMLYKGIPNENLYGLLMACGVESNKYKGFVQF